jgi:S-methylmethionine-dependent homocysteine/selenocysteine methylase
MFTIYPSLICQSLFNISLGTGKVAVQEEFRKQIKVFVEAGLDFLLCEVTCLMIGSTCLLSGSH